MDPTGRDMGLSAVELGAEGRQARLQRAIEDLERRFGSGVVYRLSQARPKLWERSVSTGSLGLDLATGIGGVPRGRITTIDGPESSGKTTVGYHVLANAQVDGGLAAFVDAEQSGDVEELRRCGADLADLVLGVPESAAEALGMAEILAYSASVDAVVLSSLPRPYPSSLLIEGMRRLAAAAAGTPTALVLVGLAGGSARAPAPEGASLGLRLRPIRLIARAGGDVVGLRVRAEVVKNRLAPPGASAELEIVEGKGIHRQAELLDLGLRTGLIEASSLGLAFGETLLGFGRAQAIARLERDADVAARLEGELRRRLRLVL